MLNPKIFSCFLNKIKLILLVLLSGTLLSCQLFSSFRGPDSLTSAPELKDLKTVEESTTEHRALSSLAEEKPITHTPLMKEEIKNKTSANKTKATPRSVNTSRKPIKPQSRWHISSSPKKPSKKESYVSSFGAIQIDDNERVDKWINYFQTAGQDKMALYLSRSTRYLNLMKQALREEQLPEDLVYVAMIESGFSPYARSFANAVGYWQFIEGTARRYGLKVNSYVDERRDPILSTRAAARYFKDLYNVFTSWPLALASYNAGEYRVHRSVLRYYTKDFWFLSAKRSLPRETANYVPKFMAALQISKNPAQYGFENIQYQEAFQYDKVPLVFPISLKKLAKNLNISYQDLRRFNPRYRSEYVPLEEEQTYIRVPPGQNLGDPKTLKACSLTQATETGCQLLADSYMKKPPFVHSDHYWYRVKRGDTLYRLARRNKTNVSTIRRMNKMGRRSFLRAGRKIKLPYYSRSQKSKSSQVVASSHTVKKGENLHSIASQYKVQVQQIRKLNNLSAEAVIHPGQILKLIESPAVSKTENNKMVHIVQRGETLISIAKKYGVPLSALMKKNGLNFKSILATGRYIVIPRTHSASGS